jgi:thioredoxin-dependent peroxiredoxin
MRLFEQAGAQVLAVSVSGGAANRQFAEKLGVSFPLLSDTQKSVAKSYRVLHPLFRVARRVTFVIDQQGVIRQVERGSAAIDPGGALEACLRLARS